MLSPSHLSLRQLTLWALAEPDSPEQRIPAPPAPGSPGSGPAPRPARPGCPWCPQRRVPVLRVTGVTGVPTVTLLCVTGVPAVPVLCVTGVPSVAGVLAVPVLCAHTRLCPAWPSRASVVSPRSPRSPWVGTKCPWQPRVPAPLGHCGLVPSTRDSPEHLGNVPVGFVCAGNASLGAGGTAGDRRTRRQGAGRGAAGEAPSPVTRAALTVSCPCCFAARPDPQLGSVQRHGRALGLGLGLGRGDEQQ